MHSHDGAVESAYYDVIFHSSFHFSQVDLIVGLIRLGVRNMSFAMNAHKTSLNRFSSSTYEAVTCGSLPGELLCNSRLVFIFVKEGFSPERGRPPAA